MMIGARATLEAVDRQLGNEMAHLAGHAKHRFLNGIGVGELQVKSDGDTTHAFDSDLEDALLRFFEGCGLPSRFSSEEREDVDLAADPQFVVLVDPLDGSEVAARGYPMCSISVAVVEMGTRAPVLSRIVEVFTGFQYAARDGIATMNGVPMKPSRVTRARDAMVVSYFASRSRIGAFAGAQGWDAFKLLLNYGGLLDIAKVGAGQCDAMVEVLKGMVAREYIAGVHIAATAGATATTLSGDPVPVLLERDARSKFVVAATPQLHEELLRLFSAQRGGP